MLSTFGKTISEQVTASGGGDIGGVIGSILGAVFIVIAVVAVIVIIIGGIGYTTSQGDPGKVKKAKNTILYGIIGLIISVAAYAIVNFVLNKTK